MKITLFANIFFRFYSNSSRFRSLVEILVFISFSIIILVFWKRRLVLIFVTKVKLGLTRSGSSKHVVQNLRYVTTEYTGIPRRAVKRPCDLLDSLNVGLQNVPNTGLEERTQYGSGYQIRSITQLHKSLKQQLQRATIHSFVQLTLITFTRSLKLELDWKCRTGKWGPKKQ